jgi:uncharacterized protein YbjT (DUF2867 family)
MILVTGATGYIGRSLVSRLLADGWRVRVLLPSSRQRKLPWTNINESNLEIVSGNLFDDEAIFHAVTGVYVIFHLENSFWWGNARDLERVEVVGTRNIITAARAARVGRIITLSHLGASPSSGFTLHKTKGQVEELIRSSGLAYTIIRSGIVFGPEDAFVNHLAMVLAATPILFPMPGNGEVNLHPIYIDDLIEALVKCLHRLSVVDQVLEVGGVEYLSFEDMVSTIMRVNRTPRIMVRMPPYVLRWIARGLGLIFPRTLMTSQWLDVLASNRVARISNLYSYFGVRPRRFEDTLVGYLPQKRYIWQAIRYVFKRRPRES